MISYRLFLSIPAALIVESSGFSELLLSDNVQRLGHYCKINLDWLMQDLKSL